MRTEEACYADLSYSRADEISNRAQATVVAPPERSQSTATQYSGGKSVNLRFPSLPSWPSRYQDEQLRQFRSYGR